jgi:hypothetical protein
MPDGDYRQRPRYVTWDRWDAEHHALREQESLEHENLRTWAAAEHARLGDRLDDIEAAVAGIDKWRQQRKDRTWTVVVTVLAGLLLPLAVAAILAVTTARP